ncbi:hypothetical protein [Methylomonas sp. AM2-LC]|uniref:hypothetical protein n=1 Tax=Methylomonas sp. AM2-LC TaxID=3153301 RepID=UPI003266E23C
MKKILIYITLLILVGCAEKQEYEQAVVEQMKQEKDIKDYKIEPEEMAKCVVQTTANNMPGLFTADPTRLNAYKNYTKMLKLNSSSDPKKTLEELRTDFGDAKKLADAHANYTESVLNCMSGLVTSDEKELVK